MCQTKTICKQYQLKRWWSVIVVYMACLGSTCVATKLNILPYWWTLIDDFYPTLNITKTTILWKPWGVKWRIFILPGDTFSNSNLKYQYFIVIFSRRFLHTFFLNVWNKGNIFLKNDYIYYIYYKIFLFFLLVESTENIF